jgi:hypothetical protein
MLFDDPSRLDPSEVLDWYGLCSGALFFQQLEIQRIRAARESFPNYLPFELQGATPQEVDDYFTQCQEELDVTAVFTLIAGAEARVRLDAIARASRGSDYVGKRIRVLLSKVPEAWQIPLYEGGIIDVWKDHVTAIDNLSEHDRARIRTAIGRLKDALPLRHWVAHGRYFQLRRPIGAYPPSTVAAVVAALYTVLSEVSTNQAGMMPFQ